MIRTKCSHYLRPSIFSPLLSICQSIVLLFHLSQQQTEVVTRGGIMRKIVYFKLMQIVLTLVLIWQLLSLHQLCGTFADPKAFIHENISVGNCKRFTLIGKESKSGEFSALFDEHKWYNQLSMNSTNDRPIEEQQHQFMDELAAKLPPAGRLCIPITILPLDWIDMANVLNNVTLFYFSGQLFVALCSLFLSTDGFMDLLHSVEEYEYCAYYNYAFCSVASWCVSAATSSKLLLNWTHYFSCVNFRADHTNVPLVTLLISIVLACSSVVEIFFKNSLVKKRPMCASTAAKAHHHKQRNDIATGSANVIIHQQPQQKNGSAVMRT